MINRTEKPTAQIAVIHAPDQSKSRSWLTLLELSAQDFSEFRDLELGATSRR